MLGVMIVAGAALGSMVKAYSHFCFNELLKGARLIKRVMAPGSG